MFVSICSPSEFSSLSANAILSQLCEVGVCLREGKDICGASPHGHGGEMAITAREPGKAKWHIPREAVRPAAKPPQSP